MKRCFALALAIISFLAITTEAKRAPAAEDIYLLKDIGGAQLSPDGKMIAYVVSSIDRAANRYSSNIWLVPTQGGEKVQLTTGEAGDSNPRWSPDGKKIAFASGRGGKPGLWIIDVATREMKMLTEWQRSNFFHSKSGEMFCWSPDSREIAFVAVEKNAQPAGRDPIIISRLQYKNRTSFSDNLRMHIFIISVEGGDARQITRGETDEHSIDWSPRGDEIVFLSNRERDSDANFNYDIFAVDVKTARERRLTNTPGVELSPVWSPDGNLIAYSATKRNMTTIDSVAEDTHIWVIDREGGKGREVSASFDRRASAPEWSSDGRTIYFAAGDQGKTLIFRVSRDGGQVTPLFDERCQINSLSVAGGSIAFALSRETAPAEIWSASPGGDKKELTSINKDVIDDLEMVKPERVQYKSFDGVMIEGWLMRPMEFQAGKKYPMILSIHGGPHGMYGYGFNHTHQLYAARGYAVLYLNPRGSSGYGQKFSDGCVNNWGGGDYQDLMKGVDYILAENKWIDGNRLGVIGGSYGGFMTNWVITQTTRFKSAVAVASLSNLISFYGTSLYQDLVHVEFNGFPWDNYDLLWKYSPMRYVKNVTTPTMFIHGELDNDVHITQAEEMYQGIRRRGIESVFVRYPREGHGVREPQHRIDYANRVLGWFDKFLRPNGE